jgi:hypothetical protein
MNRNVLKILPLVLSLLLAACPKSGGSTSGGILTLDETEAARAMIIEANGDLKQIKQRFKDNEDRLQALQQAIKNKDETKVRDLCDQLVTEINSGTELGKEAIEKIRVAQEMNINDDFKEYLRLKVECLEKYVEAFDKRREAAILLRDGYDPKNASKRDQFLFVFKQKEDEFKDIMEEARKSSQEANELAIETSRRRN